MKNYSKQDWLSALYVAHQHRKIGSIKLIFKQIKPNGIRWECTFEGNNFQGTGVSKKKSAQIASQRLCEHLGLEPILHARSYRLPAKLKG